jgi:D-alanine-D-alanine ligase
LVQVAAVEEALSSLGHHTRRLPCTLNLETVEEALTDHRPAVVFNLVESLGGSDRLAHLAAVLLDDLDLPYTGASSAALHLTTNKPRAKARLAAAGLPTPPWTLASGDPQSLSPPYIIKAIWEHASVGLDDHAVICDGDGSTVGEQIASRSRQLGQASFAEQFIEGREFNLSLIATPDGPRVLPPAEIDFSSLPPNKPRIVGYAAKWDEEAVEYASTPRTFDFSSADAPLLDWLRALAVQCWKLFDLRGYARVDFRVDSRGQPWILEINANPCLSPDAGFAAALARADIPLASAVSWILDDALRPGRVQGSGFSVQIGSDEQGTVDLGQDPRRAMANSQNLVLSTQSSVLSTHDRVPAVDAPEPLSRDCSTSSAPATLTTKKKRRGPAMKLRTDARLDDCQHVRDIVAATGLFRPGEIDVAVELVEARLEKGPASGYEFVFAEQKGAVVGYVCFGKNANSVSSYDLYWIAVEPGRQGQGIGRLLMEQAEQQIRLAGGTRIYLDTSSRGDYQPTRRFYESCGYQLAAVLDDFYAPGDSKAIYVKAVNSNSPEP